MRVEINDEAGRLRQMATPIQCTGEAEQSNLTNATFNESHDSRRSGSPECEDCGDHPLSCRCNPGEG